MKKIYILTAIFFTIGISACKKDFLSQEINPNLPSVASPQNALSAAEAVTASLITGGNYSYLGVWLGQTCPSGNYVPSAILETYNFTNTSFQVFNPIYLNLANYNALINTTSGNASLAYFASIAQIMSVYDWEELVDNYGNIPYSQALNSGAYLFPAYDDASTIYDNLLVKLDGAITLAQTASATSPGSSDIVFGGTMSKWIKFANTLKLRIAIRQWTKLPANQAALKTELASTASLGYIDDTVSAAANPGYAASDANGGQQSPFWLNFGYTAAGAEISGHAYYRANKYEVNLLNSTNDPRLSRIFAAGASAGTTINGNVLGNDATNVTNATAGTFGPGILIAPTMPAVLLSSAEGCFLLSEGILDGIVAGSTASAATTAPVSGSAQDYFQRGITASMVALGVPSATGTTGAAATYYSQSLANINWNFSNASFATEQQAIIVQKYIALSHYGWFEIYNEFRRTGYPNNLPRSTAAGALGTGPVPNRIYYPSTEFTNNAANVPTNINAFTSKIFWAQ